MNNQVKKVTENQQVTSKKSESADVLITKKVISDVAKFTKNETKALINSAIAVNLTEEAYFFIFLAAKLKTKKKETYNKYIKTYFDKKPLKVSANLLEMNGLDVNDVFINDWLMYYNLPYVETDIYDATIKKVPIFLHTDVAKIWQLDIYKMDIVHAVNKSDFQHYAKNNVVISAQTPNLYEIVELKSVFFKSLYYRLEPVKLSEKTGEPEYLKDRKLKQFYTSDIQQLTVVNADKPDILDEMIKLKKAKIAKNEQVTK